MKQIHPEMLKPLPKTQERLKYRLSRQSKNKFLCFFDDHKNKFKSKLELTRSVPLAKGGDNTESNLMSFCTSCHSEITAREGGRWKQKAT